MIIPDVNLRGTAFTHPIAKLRADALAILVRDYRRGDLHDVTIRLYNAAGRLSDALMSPVDAAGRVKKKRRVAR